MNRIVLSVLAAASFAATLQAQCFESNFGVLAPRGVNPAGVGDDVLFDVQPLNFSFPMGGTFTAYTHAQFNSNGALFLWNAATGIVGATSTGYSTAAATQLTNLQGAAGGAPRIAPFWRDLNMLAANGGGVWVNNTLPGKFVVTWANAVQFGSTTPVFTFQAQLFQNGDIQFFYNGTAASTSAMIVGVSAGGAIAAVPGSNLNPGPNTAATQLIFEQFAANTFDLQTTGVLFAASGGGYSQSAAPCIPASNSNYGSGCYAIPGSGRYEVHADAALASTDLQGNAIQFVNTGAGYTGSWSAGGAAALYLAPTGAAVALPTNDDGNASVTLVNPIPTPAGPVGVINVSSNGIVTFGAVANNGGDFSPTGPELASAAGAAFYTWHDFNTTELGSGLIKVEEAGGVLYVTWDGVESYSTPAGVNPSTIQYQFNLTTGNVNLVFVTVDSNTTSTFGSNYVVGWKGIGAIADAGSIDLSAALPFTNVHSPVLALSMSASPNPVSTPTSGTAMTYAVSNIPLACPSPAAPIFFGGVLLNIGQDLPGTDLLTGYSIDAPGCNLHIVAAGAFPLVPFYSGPTSSNSVPFALPAGVPSGLEFYAQAFALVCPGTLPNGLNNAGIVVSNGVRSVVSSF